MLSTVWEMHGHYLALATQGGDAVAGVAMVCWAPSPLLGTLKHISFGAGVIRDFVFCCEPYLLCIHRIHLGEMWVFFSYFCFSIVLFFQLSGSGKNRSLCQADDSFCRGKSVYREDNDLYCVCLLCLSCFSTALVQLMKAPGTVPVHRLE